MASDWKQDIAIVHVLHSATVSAYKACDMNIKVKKMNLGRKKVMTLYLTKLGRDKINKLYGLNS